MSFPAHKEKYDQPSQFSPKGLLEYMRSIGRGPGFEPPEAVIFTWQRSILDYVKQKYAPRRESVFGNELLFIPDAPVAVCGGFGIGAPVSVTLLEEFIAFGVKRFGCLGTAGTLQKDIKIGDLILCDSAIRDEGTSYHYLPAEVTAVADKTLTDRAASLIDAAGLTYHRGAAWTTDAPFRETRLEIDRFREEGVLVVEMEAAAMFAAAAYRQVPIFSLFSVSDCLASPEWKPAFGSKATKKGQELLFPVALETLLS